MEDYLEKPIKKKKKHESEKPVKAKPSRNFQIIDDDIGLNSLNPTQEQDILVDLLDPEGPAIVDDVLFMNEKPKVVNKVDLFTNNAWIQVDVCETEDGDLVVGDSQNSKSLFKKRGEKEKLNHSNQNKISDNEDQDSDLDIPRRRSGDQKIKKDKTGHSKNNSQNDSDFDDLPRTGDKKRVSDDLSPKRRRSKSQDSDLDYVPRRRTKDNSPDLSPPRPKSSDKDKRKSSSSSSAGQIRIKEEKDLSPDRKTKKKDDKQMEIDETKVRVRKLTKEEEAKKLKQEEIKKKYDEWKTGLVQIKQQEEKIKDYVHEVDKPLARHADDKDLEKLLKSQEREDDPMLEYMRKQNGDQTKEPAKKYRGPPAPPNRYNIMPGSKWDGVDRSNGFEKKFFASIMDKKARQEEAYKWSVEDM